MKIKITILFFVVTVGFLGCSRDDDTGTVTESSPVAVDDFYETIEGKEIIIRSYLDNDQVVDNTTVDSVDAEGASATVVLEANGNIRYTPNEGFAGVDIFTYTFCDDDETPTCSTATITVTVADEGAPTANDDQVVVNAGANEVAINNILVNDDLFDDAVLTSVDAASTQGTVVLNNEDVITYTAPAGFVGEDTFTYSICDDDLPEPTCSTATVTVLIVDVMSFNIPANLQDYYGDAVFTHDSDLLLSELSELSEGKHVNRLEYYMRHDYLYDADASLSNPDYVVLMYTGELRPWQEYQQGYLSEGETFNTEHVFPQSRLASQEAKNDMHHMRVADIMVNETRFNYPFSSGSGEANLINGNSWYPGDEWKGDVARMVMYVHIRYGEPFSDVGNLELFLRWNAEDPVSTFELQRQEIIEGAQGNRNPFIDNPYLATLIWGGEPAENTWD